MPIRFGASIELTCFVLSLKKWKRLTSATGQSDMPCRVGGKSHIVYVSPQPLYINPTRARAFVEACIDWQQYSDASSLPFYYLNSTLSFQQLRWSNNYGNPSHYSKDLKI